MKAKVKRTREEKLAKVREFAKYKKEHGIKQDFIAKKVKKSEGMISQVFKGKKIPSDKLIDAIEKALIQN